MPTKEEWRQVFTRLAAKLNLPCELKFDRRVKVGQHYVADDGTCRITINPNVDFRVPEHLILHEGAHCRAMEFDEYHGHDDMWAGILCKMYEESGVPLPQTTSFVSFAKAAGIERKNFATEGE